MSVARFTSQRDTFLLALDTIERAAPHFDGEIPEVAAVFGRLEGVKATLLPKLTRSAHESTPLAAAPPPAPIGGADRFGGRDALRVNEAAERLGLSVGHIRNEIDRGNLAVAKLGRAVVIPVEALREYLEQRTDRAPVPRECHRSAKTASFSLVRGGANEKPKPVRKAR